MARRHGKIKRAGRIQFYFKTWMEQDIWFFLEIQDIVPVHDDAVLHYKLTSLYDAVTSALPVNSISLSPGKRARFAL